MLYIPQETAPNDMTPPMTSSILQIDPSICITHKKMPVSFFEVALIVSLRAPIKTFPRKKNRETR